MLKALFKFIFDIIIALGAIACILVWLGIKPGDLSVLTPAHWMWLAAGIFLGLITLASSGYSLYQSTLKIRQLRESHTEEIQEKISSSSERLRHELDLVHLENGRLTAESREDREEAIKWKQQTATLETELAKHQTTKTSRLEIHKATWWNQRKTVSRDVLQEVREKLASDGWVFRVDSFESVQDPEEGDDYKFLEIDYTFNGERKIGRWGQRSFVVLPEIADQLNLQISDVAGNVSGMRLDGHGTVLSDGRRFLGCKVTIALSLHNLGTELVQIAKLTLASTGKRNLRCLLNMLEKPITIQGGDLQKFSVEANIEFDDDGSGIIPQPLFLIATDSHNAKHWVPVKVEIPELPLAAPRLSIAHKYDHSKQCDVLILSNDKDVSVDPKSINFDLFQVTIKHTIAARSAIPDVPGGSSRECPVLVYNGATNEAVKLYDLLRNNPNNAVNTIRAYYSGSNRMFCRDYKLTEDPTTQIVTWEAGAVRLASSLEAL